MRATSIDIKDMLEAESHLGLVFGQNLHIGREPASPTNCVTIYDAPGSGIDITADTKNEQYHRNAVQIRIRNTEYLSGMTLAYQIVDELHGRNNDTWNDIYYAFIRCSIPPTPLKWDELNRIIIVINFEIQRR